MAKVRHLLEAAIAASVWALVQPLPRGGALALGAACGQLCHRIDRRHRLVALENVSRVFGDQLDERQRRELVRHCFVHFGRTTADLFRLFSRSEETLRRVVRIHGIEHLEEAYAKGKGVLVISGHFGHWELVALMQAYLGRPLTLIARRLDNPYLERVLLRMRTRSGNRVIDKHSSVREMVRTLRGGGGVAIVIDQDQGARGIPVPFFGRLASTTPTPASLSLRTGARILPAYAVPVRRGRRYEIVYEPPIEFRPSGNHAADVQALTALCTARLECWIRERPELWMWMHRRWKSSARDRNAPSALSWAAAGDPMRRAVFIDLEGTLAEERSDSTGTDSPRLLPGASHAVRRINEAGWQAVIVANRPELGLGLLDEDGLAAEHERLRETLLEDDARLDGIYHCPHHPQAAVERYRGPCGCRKPADGLLRRAEAEMGVDLGSSYLVGDRLCDLQAARAAGVHPVLVRTGKGRETEASLGAEPTCAHVADDLDAATTWILGREAGA